MTKTSTLKYKDYIGSVEFSEEDNVFFGKLEGMMPLSIMKEKASPN